MTDFSQDCIACSMIVGEEVSLELFAKKLRMVAAVGVADGVNMIVHPSMLLVMARAFEASHQVESVNPMAEVLSGSTGGMMHASSVNDCRAARFEIDDFVGPSLGLIPVLGLALAVSIFLWVVL